jgi:hypothetical protein
VACLDGHSPFEFANVIVYDGINHPRDRNGGPRIAGNLRFEPAQEP